MWDWDKEHMNAARQLYEQCVPWSGSGIKVDFKSKGEVDPSAFAQATVTTFEQAMELVPNIGFPIMVKASEGGGGTIELSDVGNAENAAAALAYLEQLGGAELAAPGLKAAAQKPGVAYTYSAAEGANVTTWFRVVNEQVVLSREALEAAADEQSSDPFPLTCACTRRTPPDMLHTPSDMLHTIEL